MFKSKSGKQIPLKELFPFHPEANVVVIWDNGHQRKIDPIKAKELSCPMCGGIEAFTSLVDPKKSSQHYQWSCLKQECVEINTKGAKRIIDAYWEKKARERGIGK